ncbi:MAG: BACON domain-containing protein [bacterium]
MISRNPSSMPFTAMVGGSNPPSQTLQITHNGTGTLHWSVSDNQPWLSLSPTSGNVAQGGTANVTAGVNISTLSAGNYSATITISGLGATNTPQTSVTLTVTERAPALFVSPTDIDLGTHLAGFAFSFNFTVRNDGGQTLTGNVSENAPWITNLSPTSFSRTAGQQTTINFSGSFPSAPGSFSTTINVTSNGGNQNVTVRGVVQEAAPTLFVSPTDIDLGTHLTGFAFSFNFTVRNDGGQTLTGNVSENVPWITNLSPTSFSRTAGQQTTINFSGSFPSAPGSFSTTINVTSNGGIQNVTVRGVVQEAAPALFVSPANIDLGTHPAGFAFSSNFTVRNDGGQTLTGNVSENVPWITNLSPTSFSRTAGQQTTINFSGSFPSAPGSFSTTINVTSNGGNQNVTVLGVVQEEAAPILFVSPSDINLGTHPAGFAFSSSFIVRNDGGQTLTGNVSESAPWIASLSPASFNLTTGQQSVASFSGNFPSSPGPFSTTINVTSNGGNQSVNVHGVVEEAACTPTVCTGPALYPAPRGGALGNPIRGRNGDTVYVEIRMQENPQPVGTFGFRVLVDAAHLRFVRSQKGELTTTFAMVEGRESPPGSGSIACSGVGATPIPASRTGVLLQLVFVAACAQNPTSEITIGNLSDNVAGFAGCCNTFECSICLSDGDVNGDHGLTPGDALCAFNIYLNFNNLPADCDVPNFECEEAAADVTCDGIVTSGDALAIYRRFLAGLAPAECFGKPIAARTSLTARALKWHTSTMAAPSENNAQELLKLTLALDQSADLSAFGLQLLYPSDRLEYRGVKRGTLTADWIQLDALSRRPGMMMVGGFHPHSATPTAGGELLEVLFAVKTPGVEASDFVISNLADDLRGAVAQVFHGDQSQSTAKPDEYKLYQNFPNPLQTRDGDTRTVIRFDLPDTRTQTIEIAIYNVAGQLVRRLQADGRASSSFELSWDAKDEDGNPVPTGTYWYRVQAGEFVASKQLLVVR